MEKCKICIAESNFDLPALESFETKEILKHETEENHKTYCKTPIWNGLYYNSHLKVCWTKKKNFYIGYAFWNKDKKQFKVYPHYEGKINCPFCVIDIYDDKPIDLEPNKIVEACYTFELD